ncbi:MAG: beta-galactosidase [Brachybacterium sp.]|nr:beta-galactosidase [Brachybacterium sp.]
MTARLVPTPDGFLRDGVPHQIISGAVHYFRVHPELWRDRLRRLVAMGCDTVETYVAWNLHEPAPGEFCFKGIADLGRFLDLAAEEGLDAIVRPGPYICAEWENGGFPGWLLADRSMRLRVSDDAYLDRVDSWFDVLIPVIAARQASRGGTVVMVQVENEYGSFGDDTSYLEHLRDGLIARGITELLVTSDGPSPFWLAGGSVDGVLATVNFGSRTQEVLQMAREALPNQPLMCMEFWNGWFDHWGEEHHTRDADSAATELEAMLEAGMSVNFYMAHGGTHLGLTAGANTHEGRLQPTTTSYDYDAPIAEDGTLTPKFHAFREVIGRHRELPPLEEHLETLGLDAVPARGPVTDLAVSARRPLLTTGHGSAGDAAPVFPHPPAFEDIGLERGLQILSRDVELTASTADDGSLLIPPLELHDLRDRAWVLADGHHAGAFATTDHPGVPVRVDLTPLAEVLFPDGPGGRTVRLEIIVENLGRVNFGPLLGGRKGILGGVWQQVRFLNGWHTHGLALEEFGDSFAAALEDDEPTPSSDRPEDDLPLLLGATFTADTPADAFLDVTGAGHGVAYVNGQCIGRYWSIGPQQSLYIPAPLIRDGENQVVLLELEEPHPRLALAAGPIFATPAR